MPEWEGDSSVKAASDWFLGFIDPSMEWGQVCC